jgi:enolase
MSKIVIKTVHAHETINSAGNPTLQIELYFSNGHYIQTNVPSDNAKSMNAKINELRDRDPKRLNGMGLIKAASFINSQIAPKLINRLPFKQQDFDKWLLEIDGTNEKSKLGLNTVTALSRLMAKAGTYIQGIPLFYYIYKLYLSLSKQKDIKLEKMPIPIFTLINGGQYGGSLDFEDFYFIPSSTFNFSKSLEMAMEIYQDLYDTLKSKNIERSTAIKGGYTINNMNNIEVLDIFEDIAAQKNLKIGLEAFFGINCNAKHYYNSNRYSIKDKGGAIKADEYLKWIKQVSEKHSLLILKDMFQKDDWDNWRKLYAQIAEQTYLIGEEFAEWGYDDTRIDEINKEKACTTISFRPYITGTLTESIQKAIHIKNNNLSISVNPEYEETSDDFIADFAVGIQADFTNFGGLLHSEWVNKYNRLWHIDRFELRHKTENK